MIANVLRVSRKTFNESKHKQEAVQREVPREVHVLLAHRPHLLVHQPQPPVTKATSRSICLKRLHRPAELVEELEERAEDVREEPVVPILQA